MIEEPAQRGDAALAVLCSSGIAVALQQTIVLPVLPQIGDALDTSTDGASWVMTLGLLAGAVATPVISRLADQYGRRRLIAVTLVLLLAGSIIAALSQTLTVLLIGRALQGSSVALTPVGIALMRDSVPRDRVPLGIALLSATLAIGACVGAPLSGVLVDQWGWQSIFWPTAVVAIVLLILLPIYVPESPERSPGRPDLIGAVLLTSGLVTLLLAITNGSAWGWLSPTTGFMAVGGLLVLACWVGFERRVKAPLVDLRIAASGGLLVAHAVSFGLGVVAFTNQMAMPAILQAPTATGYGHGMSATMAGLWMLPMVVAFGIVAPLTATLIRRLGAATTVAIGGLLMGVTYAARLLDTGLTSLIAASVLVTIGTGFGFAAMPSLIMDQVPSTHTAATNGLNHLVRMTGSTTGTALTGALLAALVLEDGSPAYSSLIAVFGISAVVSLALAAPYAPWPRRARRRPGALPTPQSDRAGSATG